MQAQPRHDQAYQRQTAAWVVEHAGVIPGTGTHGTRRQGLAEVASRHRHLTRNQPSD